MWLYHVYLYITYNLCMERFYNCPPHTCKRLRMMYSSTAYNVTPNRVNTNSCTGLTLPRQAPYAIKHAPTQKSALMRLEIIK